MITIQPIGGVGPFTYTIDGVLFQSEPSFSNLGAGTYHITAIDANDCRSEEILIINVPLAVTIELGGDQVIFQGDTAIIHAIVNVPYDQLASIVWTGLLNTPCQNCLTQIVTPFVTSTYSISVNNLEGCSDDDSVTLYVKRNDSVFIPNIFSPNADGTNDYFLISAAPGVREIEFLKIFDRWGNFIFAAEHFPPNDPTYAWDGTAFGGKKSSQKTTSLNPGVYVYRMMVRYLDESVQLFNGDVTLMK